MYGEYFYAVDRNRDDFDWYRSVDGLLKICNNRVFRHRYNAGMNGPEAV